MKNAKIMIVDDSPFSIAIIRDILTNAEYDVVGEASSLEEVIEVTKTTMPDVVTMDMTIPGTDGLECTHAIHEINPDIKVIIVSSMKDDEIVNKSKKENVFGYIQKPVDEEELKVEVERALMSSQNFNELEKMYLPVFKEAFMDSLNKMTKTHVTYADIDESNDVLDSCGVSVVVGIIGKYSGRMIIDLSYDTALKLCGELYKKEAPTIETATTVIWEFTNIVAGNACSMINRKNKAYGFRVAPPTVFRGDDVKISKGGIENKATMAKTNFGDVYLNVGFRKGENQWM